LSSRDGEKANVEVESGRKEAFSFLQEDALDDLIDYKQEAFDKVRHVDDYMLGTYGIRRTIRTLERHEFAKLIT